MSFAAYSSIPLGKPPGKGPSIAPVMIKSWPVVSPETSMVSNKVKM